jgi:hypothetical protein
LEDGFIVDSADVVFGSCLLLADVAAVLAGFLLEVVFRSLLGWEVDESPMFEECMDADDGADIAWETFPADGGREVFFGVFLPKVDDKVAIEFVEFWGFFKEFSLLVLLEEELREILFLYFVDFAVIKPFG